MLLRDEIEKFYLLHNLDLDHLAFMLGEGSRKVYSHFIRNEFSALQLSIIAEMSGARLAFVDPETHSIHFYIRPDNFSKEQRVEAGLEQNRLQIIFGLGKIVSKGNTPYF